MMAIGMAIPFIVACIQSKGIPRVSLKIYFEIIIPALCDLVYGIAFNYSLIILKGPATIALRYFEFIFTILENRFLLKFKFMKYAYLAIGIIFLGAVLVVVSVILVYTNDEEGEFHMKTESFWLAIVLQVFAQFCSATRSNFEQKLTHNNDLTEWFVCGMEGIYEVIILVFMLCPITYFVPCDVEFMHESLCYSFKAVFKSTRLIVLFILYIPVATMYNTSTVGIILTTNAVVYSMIEMLVSFLSWFIDLIIYHVADGIFILSSPLNNKQGEKWNEYSWIRLIGSIIYMAGAAIYMKVIRLPCFEYEKANIKVAFLNNENEGSNSEQTP